MQHPPSIRKQTSAGGVVFRKTGRRTEVVLISVKGGKVWTLPKGLIGPGEEAEAAALREVAEETGLKAAIVGKIGEVQYWYYAPEENTRYRKTVHFYLMKYLEGSTAGHDSEVDDCRWFSIEEAADRLVYKGDMETLAGARKMILEGAS